MPDYNKVLLMGRLTRDIELKYTPSNQAVAKIGLAVNHRYKTKEGESKEEVTFIECEAWARTAEVMSQYLSKGKPVFVEGRLKLDQWKDKKDGSDRSMIKVVIENFQFIDSKGGGGGDGSPQSGSSSPQRSAPASRPQGAYSGASSSSSSSGQTHEAIPEDDIPF